MRTNTVHGKEKNSEHRALWIFGNGTAPQIKLEQTISIRSWESWLTRLRKIELDLYLTQHFKIDSRRTKYLQSKDKTMM